MRRNLLLSCVAACALLLPCAVMAQNDPGLSAARTQNQKTASGGGGSAGAAFDPQNFIDQDVSKGYYTAEQGQALKDQLATAQSRVDEANLKAAGNVDKSLKHNITSGDLSTIGNGRNVSKIDMSTQAGRHDISTIAVDGEIASGRAVRNVIDDVKPALQTQLDEGADILAKRAELISNNKNVSAAERFEAEKMARQAHTTAENFDRNVGKVQVKIEKDVARLEQNRDLIVTKLDQAQEDFVSKYGPDPSKWPKAPPKQDKSPPPPPLRLPRRNSNNRHSKILRHR